MGRTLCGLLIWLAVAGLNSIADEPLSETTGTLEVLYADDFENAHADIHYFLKEKATGKRVKLRFHRKPSRELRSGEVVKVRGRKRHADADELEVAAANDENVQTLAAAPVTVAGEQRAVVLLVNFTDAPLECSAAAVRDIMFTGAQSVDGLYQETSFGNVWVTGDVFGPYTINFSSSGSCDYSAWATAAEAAAVAQGVNLSGYNRRVYVIPNANPCSWAGLGTIGGNPAKSWIGYCNLPDVYAHELGHNLALHHASTDTNNDGVTDEEYGDMSDFMGYGGVGYRQVNGAHKAQLGWLPSDKLLQVTGSGVFQLAPLEADPSSTPHPQTLVVTVPGSDYSYYLSYRRPLGYDGNLYSSYSNRLNIHRYRGGTTPTRFVKALTDGTSYSDATAGLIVTQLSHNDASVTFQVSYGCAAAAPTVSLSPATAQGSPGQPVPVTFRLTNNDRDGCGTTTFHLSPSLPAGWTATGLPASLTVAAEAASMVTLTVTAPVSATNGNHSVGVGVTDNFYTAHNATATAVVQLATLTVPSPTNLVARTRRNQVWLTWRLPRVPPGGSRVARYIIWRDGAEFAIKPSRGFRDRPVAAGSSHSYYVTAVDAAGNSSPPSNVAAVTVLASR